MIAPQKTFGLFEPILRLISAGCRRCGHAQTNYELFRPATDWRSPTETVEQGIKGGSGIIRQDDVESAISDDASKTHRKLFRLNRIN
jgi:hypothetical protein